MPLWCCYAKLTYAPRLIRYCLKNFGTALLIIMINLVDALAVYISEVRMFMCIAGRKLVWTVPQHDVKTTEAQERPAVHAEPNGKTKLVEKVAFGLLNILDRQNMLGGFYFKHK